MVLQLFNNAQQFVCIMDELHRKFGFYSPEDGYGIHVRTSPPAPLLSSTLTWRCAHPAPTQILDTNPHSLSANGWLEDVSLVKKYEISEEAYNKRESECEPPPFSQVPPLL